MTNAGGKHQLNFCLFGGPDTYIYMYVYIYIIHTINIYIQYNI